ncbi:unnamed protein product [Phytophthora lilii]|uniref:Unnamed protein product n=1 Tax=Phytophthora lilii TaxID=2077276 RepID=A0A9W7CQ52_9STRA|nr:unnamed protein product [Phytophthora lilii]
MATHALRDLLETFSRDGGVGPSVEQYAQAAEVLALQLLLPDEGIEAARQFVTGDGVLDDGTKLVCDRKEQEPSAATKQTTMNRNSGGVTSDRQLDTAFYPSASRSHNEAQQRHSRQEDDTSCYVMIGGTAIALAVAAAGALRYREKIHECVSNALPAISKGLADAKHALFEA